MREVFTDQVQTKLKILDVGCGDGRWWKILDENKSFDVHGIDINQSEVLKAQEVIKAQVIDITHATDLEKLGADFDLVIGNCSLEHISNINLAIKNIHSLVKPGGKFVLFVPTPHWALKGNSVQLLNRISPRLSMAFSGFLNGFFQHWHLYHHEIWCHLLARNGFEISSVRGLGNQRLEFLFRLFLPSSFISFLVKAVSGKYLNYFASFIMPESFYLNQSKEILPLVEGCLTDANDPDAFEYMITAIKKS